MVHENQVENVGLIIPVDDLCRGVIVDMTDDHMESNVYIPLLRASISEWKQEGKKGVWIKLPTHLANLIEPTIKEGFRYRHAEMDYLMLVYWIPQTPITIPEIASHTVDIGVLGTKPKKEWMPIDNNGDQPYNQKHKSFKYVSEICFTNSKRDYASISALSTRTSYNKMYLMAFVFCSSIISIIYILSI